MVQDHARLLGQSAAAGLGVIPEQDGDRHHEGHHHGHQAHEERTGADQTSNIIFYRFSESFLKEILTKRIALEKFVIPMFPLLFTIKCNKVIFCFPREIVSFQALKTRGIDNHIFPGFHFYLIMDVVNTFPICFIKMEEISITLTPVL